jgi:hypothetical protein
MSSALAYCLLQFRPEPMFSQLCNLDQAEISKRINIAPSTVMRPISQCAADLCAVGLYTTKCHHGRRSDFERSANSGARWSTRPGAGSS